MKRSNCYAVCGLLLMTVLLFSGCGSGKKTTEKTALSEESVIVGFSLGTLREERWLKDQELFTERVNELGGKTIVEFANNDAALQLSQSENLIAQGVDVLVVVPQDAEGAAVMVEKAHAAGIKVVAYDRMIKNCDLDFYVSFDSVKVGELEAKGVVDVVGEGDFAYIGGSPTDNNAFLLKEGSMKVLEPKIESGEITLVVDEFSSDWKSEEAYKTMKEYLEKSGRIDAAVCANDGTAFGAIQALSEYGLAGKVPVSGQDAELSACQRVVEGTQTVTVYKPIKSLAYQAADIAVALAKNQAPESNSKVSNGKIEVLSFLIEPINVNKDNMMETIIKDGFHTYEEVYANVPPDERPAKQ
ncbi:substrate-binding domain-containing protein [Candidatus Woesearchaeota archaeon]|nr:substrate-binding domain-containing protein [Candidatus Woesearchaeota archaeon]